MSGDPNAYNSAMVNAMQQASQSGVGGSENVLDLNNYPAAKALFGNLEANVGQSMLAEGQNVAFKEVNAGFLGTSSGGKKGSNLFGLDAVVNNFAGTLDSNMSGTNGDGSWSNNDSNPFPTTSNAVGNLPGQVSEPQNASMSMGVTPDGPNRSSSRGQDGYER